MDIQKPDTLFCATQPLDWRGAPHHAFSVLLGLDMRTGGPLAADTALAAAMQALPPGCRLDVGIPKQEAEWLLAGVVVPRSREGAVVDIRVGQSRRRFLVAASPDGAPVPLVWEKTARDPESNPLGSETPLVSDPALRHDAPACPLPLGAWPCRMKNMGTYDARWLRTRWPGLPDDADWRFFNEAQPQQRMPDGLRGDEEVRLSGFFPDGTELHFRLPGARLQLEILRRGENDWKSHAVTADTLWLFPGQRTALLYWHALVPCADEAATDIAAARLRLSPESLETVPPAAPETSSPEMPAAPDTPAPQPAAEEKPASSAVPGAAAAAGAAVAAGMAAAAASAASSSSSSADSNAAPTEAPSAPAPEAAPSGEPSFSAAEFSAAMQTELEENLPEINAALAEAGLPPLSPEQIEETRRHIDAMSAVMADIDAAPPPPTLEDQLRQAGISEERIAAVNAALELEPPDPSVHTDSASWQAASDAFLAQFSALLQPSESLRDSMAQTLRIMGPDGEAELKALAGDMPDSPQALLQKAGMSPDNAARLLDMLEQAPDDPGQLEAYARELEAAAGFPAGSVADHIRDYQETMRRLEEESSEAPAAPADEARTNAATDAGQEPAADAPPTETPTAPDADAAAETPDTAAEEPDTSAQGAPSRAVVVAMLASGASLAGLCLAGLDLSALRFDGRNLAGSDLSGANLRGASFVDADLGGANLRDADAADAVFLRARLDKAHLEGLRATDADFTEASLVDADARGADFSSALFQGSRAADMRAPDAAFDSARLRNADFSGTDLSGARLRAADLHALKLDGARLTGADLADAALSNGTQAPGADFGGANLAGSVWTGVAAPQAVFRRATADRAGFTDCDFTATGWDAVRARRADFSRCSLRGASLQRADLFEASLREARLQAADARNANLYGADLYRLGMDEGTRLDGAHTARTILAAVTGK